MSMRDLGILTKRIIEDYPEYYGYFSLSEWEFDGRAPQNRFNRNPLLKLDIGADGLKTGHTQEAGYGLVGSAQQGARRIIFVITGLETDRARAEESERIVSWAFRQFVQKDMAAAGARLAELPVWVGATDAVGLVSPEDVRPLVPMVASGSLSAEVEATTPVEAPIAAGQQLGELVISGPEMEPQRFPLVAESDVARGGAWVRMQAAAQVLFRELTEEEAVAAPQAEN